MIIIDKTQGNSSIMVKKPIPTFRTELERVRYWEEEKRRCLEGYEGIPGEMYDYIQNHRIKDRVSGKWTDPIARDCDLLIFEKIRDSKKNNRMLGVLKGRGLGLSTIGGSLINHHMKWHPGSNSLMTSKKQSNISDFFKEKVMTIYDGLHPDMRGEIISKNETTSKSYLRVRVPFRDENGNIDYGESQLFCQETSEKPDSPTAFSGTGAKFGFYDELPLHKKKVKLLNSSIECYRDPQTMQLHGFLLWGGTVESELTANQLFEFQHLIKKSEIWDTDILFIPFWMGRFMTNGHSDEKKGMEWWEQQQEKLQKADDQEALIAFRKNNPRSLDDIFDMATSARWEDDVSDKIREQYKIVVNENPPLKSCKLVEINDNIEMVVTQKAPIQIFEDPKPGVQYLVTIDGVATGSDVGDTEGSKIAVVVSKLFDVNGGSYAPVCVYCERPKTIEGAYYNILNIAKYYNKHNGLKGIMPEANAGTSDHFRTFCKNNWTERYLMRGKRNKVGQYVTKDVRDMQMKQANMFLRRHVESIKMITLLQDMMKPETENADVLDAWLMLFVAIPDIDKPIEKKKEQFREIMQIQRVNGVTQWVTKKIPIMR